MSLIFVETSQHCCLRLTGLYLAPFDEQDQFGFPVYLGTLSHDPDAARVFAGLWHAEFPVSFYERLFQNLPGPKKKPSARREPPALRLRISIAMLIFLALGFALGIKQLNTRTA